MNIQIKTNNTNNPKQPINKENNNLLEKLKTRKEIKENWELYLKEKAETENFKKRIKKEITNINKYALKEFAKDLLNILDSLEHGLNIKTNTNDKSYEGLKLIHKMFLDILKKHNINKITAKINTPFDPSKHEVVSVIKNENNNYLTNIIQDGYTLHDRVLRYTKVIISKDS